MAARQLRVPPTRMLPGPASGHSPSARLHCLHCLQDQPQSAVCAVPRLKLHAGLSLPTRPVLPARTHLAPRPSAVCSWGSADNGRLGNNMYESTAVPELVPDLDGEDVLQVRQGGGRRGCAR